MLRSNHVYCFLLRLQKVLYRNSKRVKKEYNLSIQKTCLIRAQSNNIKFQTGRLKFYLALSELNLLSFQAPIYLQDTFGTCYSDLASRCKFLREVPRNLDRHQRRHRSYTICKAMLIPFNVWQLIEIHLVCIKIANLFRCREKLSNSRIAFQNISFILKSSHFCDKFLSNCRVTSSFLQNKNRVIFAQKPKRFRLQLCIRVSHKLKTSVANFNSTIV